MNIKGCTSYLISICAAVLLTACDIGPSGLSSGFDNAADEYTPPAEGPTVAISGVAAKGLVVGGVVNIHPIVNGALDTSISVGSGVTDNTGSYNINVDNYDGNPFVVRVSASDTTTMVCDLAGGCNGQPFGSNIPLTDTSFNMDAVVPPIPVSSPNASVNISVLTDTASKVALNALSSNTDTSLETVTQLVRNANSSVANRFNISGDLTSLPVVDLTSPAALVNVAQDVIEYNLLSAGIVESLVNGGANMSIANAVQSFSNQFVTNGGLADTETTDDVSNVTLAEIFERASSIVNSIQTTDTGGTLNLGSLTSVIDANLALAQVGSTTPNPGTPTDTSLDDLAKVKAMVAELRKVGTGIQTGFVNQQALLDATLDDDSGAVLSAVSSGVSAIGDAWSAYDMDNTTTSFTHENGLTVSISAVEGVVTYAIDGEISVLVETDVATMEVTVDLMLTAIDDGSSLTTTVGDNGETSAASVILNVNGSATSDMVALTVSSGSVTLNATGTSAETQTDAGMTETVTLAVSGFEVDLALTIIETSAASDDPVSFNGNLSFAVTNLAEEQSSTTTQSVDQQDMVIFLYAMSSELSADTLNVSLSGTFSAPSGASLTASININADGTDFSLVCSESDTASSCAPEDAVNFLDFSFASVFSVDSLGDINSLTKVLISGSRSGLNTGEVSIRVIYGGVILSTTYQASTVESNSSTLTITDQNSVMLTVTETIDANDTSTISGIATLNNVQYATLTEDANGLVIVSYSDGFNETLW